MSIHTLFAAQGNRDIISIQDLGKSDILTILDYAESLSLNPQPDLLRGRLLASCFFEPSTRTRLSFEAAMHRLGGSCIGFSEAGSTSAKKGESLQDTMRMVEQYADIIVLRHPREGAAQLAADAVSVPVINAGDGSHQHPTQTLLDLYSIKECQGTLENLRIAFVGDLKYGRTVHSLAQACCHFGARLYLVSPPSLELPQDIYYHLKTSGVKFSLHRTIEEVLPKVDILYMTRIQEERFEDPSAYQRVKGVFALTAKMLEDAKENLRVLHPLPRLGEIDVSVDRTPHAYYFEQAKNGLFVRQAVLGLLLGALS